jgi:hypothetical protein
LTLLLRKLQRSLTLCLSLVALAAHLEAYGAPDTKKIETEPQTLEWIVDTRNYWGQIIGDTGKRLDGFFAGEDQIDKSNDSFLKISLKGIQYKSGRSYLEPKLKFRLDLPTVEEKLKLVIESDTPEEKSLEQKRRSQLLERDTENSDATSALELELNRKRDWKANTSVGVKIGDPIDPFWRLKGNARYAFDRNWSVSTNDSIFYFHEKGWGAKAQLTFQRESDWFVFRQTNDGRYDHKSRRWELGHTYSFLRELSNKRAINYEVGVIAETKPEVQAIGYFIHAIYRRKLHADWLFYEMTPELYYPRSEDWELSPSFSAKIEIVFSSPD